MNPRSPLFNFVLGLVFGAIVGSALTTYFLARLYTRDTIKQKSTTDILQKIADTWQARAEKCELRDRNATVLYGYRPNVQMPFLHGAFSITLGSESNHPVGDYGPLWVIPAQVPVYTNLPNAQYEWVDGKTGATIGRFVALPPPAQVQEQR